MGLFQVINVAKVGDDLGVHFKIVKVKRAILGLACLTGIEEWN